MDNLQKYLKSLNPQKKDQVILFPGSIYKLWRNGKYLGQAKWTLDENVGDSFQRPGKTPGRIEVVIADKWELIIRTK